MPWIGFVIPGRNDRRRLAPPILARVSGPSTDEVRQLHARLDGLTMGHAVAGLAGKRRQTNR
jgi:hypothetical protein